MTIQTTTPRNRLRGPIRQIVFGEVVSQVAVETPAGLIMSVISSKTLKMLGLYVGMDVCAVLDTTEVGLTKA
jgi:molybdopterin-binding protein